MYLSWTFRPRKMCSVKRHNGKKSKRNAPFRNDPNIFLFLVGGMLELKNVLLT